MEKPTKEQEKVLIELAPYLAAMEVIYCQFCEAQFSKDKSKKDVSGPASLLAILSGLCMARGQSKITEKPDNLIFAQEIFKTFLSVKKLLILGLIEGQIEGVDEYGWPMYHITNIDETWEDKL